ILVNACRMALRTRRGVREIAIDGDGRDTPFTVRRTDRADPADTAIDAMAFDRAFDRLSVDERAILTLHHLEARGLPEVAAILGIPVGTVKSRLLRARRALERSLDRERPL
ncbi:MAG TPA: RNA polymerase sigma factor, partial [Candidatus Acidoferrales bacterium]|nr:RNA polymerase sigma factor [Candidatus Acidoferrales bacterium]